MAISKGTQTNKIPAVAKYELISPSGVKSQHEVVFGTHYNRSWYDGGRKNELFHVGGGNPWVTETEYQYDFGSYVLTPLNDFLAWAHIWGAGGGNYNSGNDSSRSGGGGFTNALIQFKAGIPYTLVVGQAGRYGLTTTTHGGGGDTANFNNTGQGGGLSGIFYNSTHFGKNPWAYSPPLSQSNALAIAGGGGSAGHHNMPTHFGAGAGGGGFHGWAAHNSEPGGQNRGGHGSYYSSTTHSMGQALHGGRQSQQATWTGAGGGGWFGGGGGGFSNPHYNGGSGGSGHHAHPREVGSQPNNALSKFILCAHTERAPSSFSSPWQYSAAFKNPLAYRSSNPAYGEYDGLYAGKAGRGNTENTGRSSALHGKIVLTLAPDILSRIVSGKNVTDQYNIMWTANSDN